MQEGCEHAGASPATTVKLIKGLQYLSFKESLKELELFRLEKRKLWGEAVILCHIHEDDARLFQCCPVTRQEAMDTKESLL